MSSPIETSHTLESLGVFESCRPESRPRRRLRVLFIDDCPTGSHAESNHHCRAFAYLWRRGHGVDHVCVRKETPAEDAGLWERWSTVLRNCADIRRLRRLIQRGAYHVVTARGDWPLTAARWAMAGQSSFFPLLVADRSGMAPLASNGRRRLPASARSSRVCHTLVSTRQDRLALVAAGMKAQRISVVAAGIDVEASRPVNTYEEARASIGVSPEAPLVCALGDLDCVDAQYSFLTGLAMLRHHVAGAKAVIVGHGDKNTLAQALEMLGVMHHVSFVEPGVTMRHYVSAADVCVCVAGDGTGERVAHAMACARPVVVSVSADPMELVRHGRDGFVVPDGDAHALAAGMAWMISNPVMAEEMAVEARGRVERTFSDRARAHQLETALINIVEKGGKN